jgi:hypothetical protein
LENWIRIRPQLDPLKRGNLSHWISDGMTNMKESVLENLITSEAENKLAQGRFRGSRNRKFITVFTRFRHQSYPEPIESTPQPQPIFPRSF